MEPARRVRVEALASAVPPAARAPRASALWAGALLALGFVSRLRHGWEWDELQLLHAAWNVAHGALPYRDFFEHHPPLAAILVAPVVGGLDAASLPVFVGLRTVALGVLVASLLLYRQVVNHVTSAAAGWALVVPLVLWPISGKFFEARADWLALLAILAALDRLLGEAQRTGKDALTGILGGVAICLTQKAIVIWLGVFVWRLVRVATAPTTTRHAGAIGLGAMIGGTALPPVLLWLAFAWHDATGALWRGVVAVNLGWPREVDWRFGWERAGATAFGWLVLAVAGIAIATVPAAAAGERLFAVLLAVGAVAYRLTPVPWEQSALFFLVPWAGGLALATLDRLARPDTRQATVVALVFAAALVAAAVPGPSLATGVVWTVAALAMLIVARRPNARGPAPLIALAVVPGALVFTADRLTDLADGRDAAQAAFTDAVAARTLPGEPVLMTWDHVLPFRPVATYHWFAHEGVLRRFADPDGVSRRLDAEYVRAIDSGRVRVAIVDPDMAAAYLPRFRRRLERRCRRVVEGYAGSDAYLCTAAAGP